MDRKVSGGIAKKRQRNGDFSGLDTANFGVRRALSRRPHHDQLHIGRKADFAPKSAILNGKRCFLKWHFVLRRKDERLFLPVRFNAINFEPSPLQASGVQPSPLRTRFQLLVSKSTMRGLQIPARTRASRHNRNWHRAKRRLERDF